MKMQCGAALAVIVAMSPFAARGQANPGQIEKGIAGLRSLPDDKRPAATAQLAMQIRDVPPGQVKLKLADELAHLSTEGDPGHETIQAVADTLAKAVLEAPQKPDKRGDPAEPYTELAKLVRYEGAATTLEEPQYKQALQTLIANDADAAKADFTLKDLKGKKVTFSELKGKIVLVNFWATWCPPCRKEMQDLDLIYTHYQPQGLVVLSLTSENPFTVTRWFGGVPQYHPQVLLDEGAKVAKQFHVDGLPTTFVYDRDGKLIAKAVDMRTQGQFFQMLATAGLKPQ